MPIPPGSTIGILGGGQLGRMLAMAASQLGYRCHIYTPEADSVAGEVSARQTTAAWNDSAALAEFATQCAVVTYEFENVPVGPLAAMGQVTLHPPQHALEIAQDRLSEKQFIEGLGGHAAPFMAVDTREDLTEALERIGSPGILKTRREGYDGKGQYRIETDHEAEGIPLGQPMIYEGFVHFSHEFSVIVVRGEHGEVRFWDSAENVHRNGILDVSRVPTPIELAPQVDEARTLAARVVDALGYVGVATFEFFATEEGSVFNEMAPRVHNSGHWTIEGALTSQFENHVRAICGLPLGDTALAARGAVMHNLIGDAASDWSGLLGDPANHVHLYGKGESRPGRKMGHVTRLLL